MSNIMQGHGVVPVIKLKRVEDALPLADALAAGGIRVMEITLRTDAGLPAIEKVSKERPDILVGAGTVLNVEQMQKAAAAGAKFIVSPGFNPDVVAGAQKLGLVVLPGCVTPTEITAAINAGLDTIKFFPASIYGGIKAIKSLASVFGGLKFMPTGGVSAANAAEFLEVPQISAIGGSWMVTDKLLDEGNFEEITRLSKEAMDIYHKVRG